MKRTGRYLYDTCAVCKHWKLPVVGNSTRHLHEIYLEERDYKNYLIKWKCVYGFCDWLTLETMNCFICDGFIRRGKTREKR